MLVSISLLHATSFKRALVVRENMEMLYQFEHDYRFDRSKAERALGLTATGYREGIAATLKG